MEQKLTRRSLLGKAGKVAAAGAAAFAGGVLIGQRPAQATGTYSNTVSSGIYYTVYPSFFNDRYHLTIEGNAKYVDGCSLVAPDFLVVYLQDNSANNIYGPLQIPNDKIYIDPSSGGYTAGGYSIPGPLNAGSLRAWVVAYWGNSTTDYTHIEASVEVFGGDADPTPNAQIPCYSGC